MIKFSDRVNIQEQFEAWCVKNETKPCMQTMIAFLEHRGWLNVEKVIKDLNG